MVVVLYKSPLSDQYANHAARRPFAFFRELVREHKAGKCLDRGIAHMGRGEYTEAIMHFNRALDHDRKYIPVFINRGICHSMLDLYGLAITDLTHATKLDPNHKNAHFNLAVTCYRAGEFDIEHRSQMYRQSIAAYENTLALDPADIGARINMGNVYGLMREWGKAIECYDAVLEIDSAHKTARRLKDTITKHISMAAPKAR